MHFVDIKVVQGFYTLSGPDIIDGKLNVKVFHAAIPEYLKVKGQFQMTAASQVSNEGLIVLHFILHGMESSGSPAKILVEYMKGFLPTDLLMYEEIVIDLSTASLVHAHTMKMEEVAARMS